ncbi:uncharacterized protein LOC117565557 [Drosophila albomicans]|uniref:Uncharacterized protein LOC117565557 n=1 Tax=Drosophila albomicans TaxID=7291 RepID=A0A6P8WA90_DROAB|nr:uncharacterized protein LOC117565557 [Drosophila albomicans]
MCFISKGGNSLGNNLCKCFQRLTAAQCSGNPGSIIRGCNPGVDKNVLNISERTKWKWRNEMPTELKSRFSGKSHKDFWYATNRNIILALGRVLGLHADVVFEFLYTLTLQNFARILNPRGHAWNLSRVPFSQVNICDYYAGIFDCNGNVRNPFHPDVLQKLLGMMQQLLRQDKSRDEVPKPLPIEKKAKPARSEKISQRAGIGPDSLARANGIRRRFQLSERYQLGGCRSQSLLCGSWDRYTKHLSQMWCYKPSQEVVDDIIKAEVTVLDWGSLQGRETSEEERQVTKALYRLLSDNLCTARSRELKRLVLSVKQQTGLQNNLEEMLDAMRELNLKMAVKGEVEYMKRMTQELSRNYNHLIEKSRKVPKRKHAAPHKPETLHIDVEEPTVLPRFYYGAQVPILTHEPFNPQLPRTWMRRHPDAMRLNDDGRFVREGVVHRYKRRSVEKRLADARQRYSIHSVYSRDDVSRSSSRFSEISKGNSETNRNSQISGNSKISGNNRSTRDSRNSQQTKNSFPFNDEEPSDKSMA